MFAIICALGLLVVGVSLVAVPTDGPSGTRTQVDGVFAVASPKPSPQAAQAPPSPAPGAGVANTSDAPPASPPFTASGPNHIAPWTTAVYRVVLNGSGTRAVDIWWTGAAMGNWTWQRVDGHCELTPSRDRLSGTAAGRVVVELDLTPSGAPGGQLVIQARAAGGPAYSLAVVSVG